MRRISNSVALGLWLASYTTLCWAQQRTLADDVLAYDWLSLLFAAAAGLLGGAARSIYTLVSSQALVGNVRVLLAKDLVVALIGGAAMFLLVQGYNSAAGALTLVTLPPCTRDLRVLLIVGAGFSRGRWFGTLDRFAADAIANASSRLRGAAQPDQPAAVSTRPAPLDGGAS